MFPCGHAKAHPQLCLDSCSGYYGRLPGIDEFLYRYYIPTSDGMTKKLSRYGSSYAGVYSNYTGYSVTNHPITCNKVVKQVGPCDRVVNPCCVEEIPDESLFPYVLGCFRGCPLHDPNCRLDGKRGYTESYIPQEAVSVSGVFINQEDVNIHLSDISDSPTPSPTAVPSPSPSPLSAEPERQYQKRILAFNSTDRSHMLLQVNAEAIINASVERVMKTTFPSTEMDAYFTSIAIDHTNNL